jgi:hypothetical protein
MSDLSDLSRKDLYDQTEDLRQEIVQHVDEKAEQVQANFAEQVDAVRSDSALQAAQSASEHRMDMMLERLGNSEAQTKAEIDKKFNKYFLLIFMAFLALLIIGGINYTQILNPQAGKTLFTLGDPTVSGPSDLCPGESLDFSFDVAVQEKGTYVLDMSTWKVDPPPATIIFSEGDRMVVGGNRSFPITRKWVVPSTYIDPSTNEKVTWRSGNYLRDISVTAGGKNVESSTKGIPFTIRENCEVPKK